MTSKKQQRAQRKALNKSQSKSGDHLVVPGCQGSRKSSPRSSIASSLDEDSDKENKVPLGAILYSKDEQCSPSTLRPKGEELLDGERSAAVLHSDPVNENFIYGNPEGYSLLQKMSELQMEVEAHGPKIKDLQEKKESAEKKSKLAEENANNAYAGYDKIRLRVYETFKRDVIDTDFSHLTIRRGNTAAHGGDLHHDVRLFGKNVLKGRQDEQIFERFYGISVERAREIKERGDSHSHNVLNDHATLAARVEKYLSEETEAKWNAAFNEFIGILNSNRALRPFENDSAALTKAYRHLDEEQTIAIIQSDTNRFIAEKKRREEGGTGATPQSEKGEEPKDT